MTNQRNRAWMSKSMPNGAILCLACSHQCRIKEGKFGICNIRQNIEGTLILLPYGKASAYNIDPIEKKPLYHFYPGTDIYSIGTIGCNYQCNFCQNWSLSQYPKLNSGPLDSGKTFYPEDIIQTCLNHNIPSIAFTYNEPAIFFEYAYDTAKLAKKHNIKTVFVSNGYETIESLEKIKPYIDAVNIDLKAFSERFYAKVCKAALSPVKQTIKWLWENNVWMEITTLLIPNQNDSEDEIKQIAAFINNISPTIPWHISRYHPDYQSKEPATPIKKLKEAYTIGKKVGLEHVYIGNIDLPNMSDTVCPKCKHTLIDRNPHQAINRIIKGKCYNCKTAIPGRFS
jgi:pyruvate formate lyase activating enzyme